LPGRGGGNLSVTSGWRAAGLARLELGGKKYRFVDRTIDLGRESVAGGGGWCRERRGETGGAVTGGPKGPVLV